MNPLNVPEIIGTDLTHLLYYSAVVVITLTILFLFFDINDKLPPHE